MQDYRPNSHRFKDQVEKTPEKKVVSKVVNGPVKVKKKSELRKAMDNFISEDTTNLKHFLVTDLVIPAVRDLIYKMVTDGLDMVLYGGNRNSGKSGSNRSSYVSYRDYSNKDNRSHNNTSKVVYSYNDVTLASRGEAEEVLERMSELIDTYGEVSVADLYDLVGVEGNYTDNNYGWTNISRAEPVRTSGGYMLRLPRALPLNK